MKKIYNAPTVDIMLCQVENSFLEASLLKKQPESTIGDEGTSTIPKEDDNSQGFEQGAKGFTAWESWDE